MHLDAIQRALGWARRQVRQHRLVLRDCIAVPFLQPRNLPPDGVQPVVVGIHRRGPRQKGVRTVNRANRHFGLRRGELQSQVLGRCVGCLAVDPRRLRRVAAQLVGIRQLRLHVRLGVADGLERGDRFRVAARLQVIAGQRPLDVRVVRGTALGQLQVVIRLVKLLQPLVGNGQQQLRPCARLRLLGSIQPRQRRGILAVLDVQLAQRDLIVDALGVGRHHPLEQSLGLVVLAHHAVALRQPGQPIKRGGVQPKTMGVGLDRKRALAVQTSGVAQQKPQLGLVGRCLRGTLRILHRQPMLPTLQGQLGGTRQPRVLNVRAKAQRLARRSRRLIGFCLRSCRRRRTYLVGLRLQRTAKRQDQYGYTRFPQATKGRGQRFTKAVDQ